MSVTVIDPGAGAVILDPSDIRTIAFDWDKRSLRASVTISTSVFTITAIQQSGTALTKDSASILNGTDATIACERTVGASRVTQVRLNATTATDGDEYMLENVIVTSENPAQTKAGSVKVMIQNR